MDILGPVVRGWQRMPMSWRRGIVDSPIAPFLRRLLNRFYPRTPEIFELAAPLNGRRMRLDWQTHKAYVFGTYEPSVTQALLQVVRPGWTVVDIGAHIGYFTLLLSELVGPQGKVIAFEALAQNFEVLRENIVLNSCDNVILESRAVAGRSGRISLRRNDDEALTSTASIESGTPIAEVDAVALDEFLGPAFGRVHLAKMDAEGAEAALLEGMREILRRDLPILLIELHGFDTYGEQHPALRWLHERGYGFRFLDGAGQQVHILAEFQAGENTGSKAD